MIVTTNSLIAGLCNTWSQEAKTILSGVSLLSASLLAALNLPIYTWRMRDVRRVLMQSLGMHVAPMTMTQVKPSQSNAGAVSQMRMKTVTGDASVIN